MQLSPNGNDAFDLSQIFIGREHQLDLFDLFLIRWTRLIGSAQATPDIQVTAAPSPNNKIQSLVVLLYGRGGFGKSTLLKHFYGMAREADRHLTVSKIVDWEFAIEGRRSIFNPPPGHEVDAHEYFRVLCGQLADALGKRVDNFREYQIAVKAVEEARKQASGVLDSLQKDERYAELRRLTVEGLVTLIRTIDPSPISKVLDNEKAKDALDEGMKIGAEQVAHVYTKLREHLGHKLSDYLEPALKLGLSLGRDLARLSKDYPLLIFFDTYEEIDEGDKLLRLVIGAAGIRVGWVVAGRDNLWAGSEQRKRSLDVEYGYKEIVPADRGLAIDFNVGGIGAFTISDVVEYFSQLREKVQYEPPLSAVTEEDAARIVEVTLGVPLAVKIAAGLYLEKTDLEVITEKADSKRRVVDEMVRRYLLHTHADQSERAKLYGLALLPRADQPSAIAAALGLSPEQATIGYEAELSRLHRRYSFIFTEKAQPSLHQEVDYFLRLWLLEHRRDPEVIVVNERLKDAHATALKGLEDRRQYSSLRERLEDEEWVGVYLDLVDQQFWLDPAEGVRSCLPFMIAAVIYRRTANQEAATIGKFFKENIRQPYRNWWKWATQSLIYYTSRNPDNEELTGLEELVKLASQRCPAFAQPLPDYRKELEAALWWRLGEAYQGRDDNKALEWYEKALCRLGEETELREATARTAWEVSYRLYEEKKERERLPFLNRAIELKSDYVQAYYSRGITYYALREYEQAMVDYNRAIELDPKNANAYVARGNAYRTLREYEQAMVDYNRAIELDPKNADAYHGRGHLNADINDYQRGIEDFNQCIDLDPKNAGYYICRGGSIYARINDFSQAIEDYNQAIALDPKNAQAFTLRGLVHFFLSGEKRASEDFNYAAMLDSKSAWVFVAQGILHTLREDHKQAIEAYNKAVELGSSEFDFAASEAIFFFRAFTYFQLGEDQQALEDLSRATELAPQSFSAYLMRGLTHLMHHEEQLALSEFDYFLTINPNFVYAYFLRGIAHYSLDAYHLAIEDFNRVVEYNSKFIQVYLLRGDAYADLQDYHHAIADYDHAIELDPTDANSYNERGNVYLDLKEYQHAIADYNCAIKLDPNYAPSYYNRGSTYLWLKDIEQASADFRYRWELNQTNLSAAWLVEWIEMCQKRPSLSMVDRLNKIAENNPQDYIACVCRGVALGLLGKLKDGVVVLEQAISLAPKENDAYFWKAMLCTYLGRNSAAEEAIEKSLENELPPILLKPLYWLDKDRPDFFREYAKPLLEQYDI